MKKSNFDELMERYLAGNVTEYERLKIEAWLDVMKTERTRDLEFSEADQERLFRRITNKDQNVTEVIALAPKPDLLKRMSASPWLKIAASVTLLLAVSLTVWTLVKDSGYFTADKEKLILNDGSIVWLKEGSRFTYYEQEDGTRQARLWGEALFEVAKIPNRTFTITYNTIRVDVIGTSFSLKTDAEQIELSVLTGKVKLSSVYDTTGIRVEPHQKVIYKTTGISNRSFLSPKEKTALTENTSYNMRFTKATMEEVLEGIARKFDVTIHVRDERVKRCRISADFTDNSLESTLRIVSDILDITYTTEGKQITLSGKGC